MPATRVEIVASAEEVFDRHGFAATGVDRLAAAAGVSTRTLYKHLGSKSGLVAAVLAGRATRFFAALDVASVDALFGALGEWTAAEGARGCLFLRAQGETGGLVPEVSEVVESYHRRLREVIHGLVAAELGRDDEKVTDQLLVLFEGATAAASYRGADAVTAARDAARRLLRPAV